MGRAGPARPPATSASFQITPAPLTVTANDRTKIYGQTVTFAGTEFTTSGLLGPDTVTSVTLTSAGAAPTATVAGSPYPITPSAAVGPASPTTRSATSRQAAPERRRPDDHGHDRSKVYGQTVVFASAPSSRRPASSTRTGTSVTLTSPGAARDRHGRRQPVPDHAVGGRRHRPRNYTITLRAGQPHGQRRRPDITAQRPDQGYGRRSPSRARSSPPPASSTRTP